MECSTCMERMASARLEPCGHTVTCTKCTVPTLVCSGLRCPVCRTFVMNLPSDAFSDKTMHSVVIATSEVCPHVGVTLKNAPGGVVVSKLADGDLGSHFLRKGDVIRAINGIPAVDHKTMVTLINACSESRTCMRFERSDGKAVMPPYLRTLAMKYHEHRASFHSEWNN